METSEYENRYGDLVQRSHAINPHRQIDSGYCKPLTRTSTVLLRGLRHAALRRSRGDLPCRKAIGSRPNAARLDANPLPEVAPLIQKGALRMSLPHQAAGAWHNWTSQADGSYGRLASALAP